MKQRKFYYLIEQLDIDGDKQSDGFLISQYKIDKHNNKIFTKNKYVTFKDFKNYAHKFITKSKKKGGLMKPNQQDFQVVYMNKEEFNNYMNNVNNMNKYPPHYPHHPPNYPHHYPPHYQEQYPPAITVQGTQQSSFASNFTSGLGGGLGVGIGAAVGDSLMEGLFGM